MPKHIITKRKLPKKKGCVRKSFTPWGVCQTSSTGGYGVYRTQKQNGQILIKDQGLTLEQAEELMYNLNNKNT